MAETRDIPTPTAFDLTIMALAEAGEQATIAAMRALGPNRAGDPRIELFGWLPHERLIMLLRAVDMAHRHHKRVDDATWEPLPIEERAVEIIEHGSWRFDEKREDVLKAARAYAANLTVVTSTVCAS
jgi:hypothetical protein